MNKFEYVSSDGHQMSQERGSLISEIPYLDLGGGWCPGLGGGGPVQQDSEVPCLGWGRDMARGL